MSLSPESRYNFSVLYLDKKNGDFFGTRQLLRLPKHESDLFHQVTDADYKRIDMIAWRYYRNVNLWWVIAEVNDISNPLEMRPGQILRIPSKDRVEMKVVR